MDVTGYDLLAFHGLRLTWTGVAKNQVFTRVNKTINVIVFPVSSKPSAKLVQNEQGYYSRIKPDESGLVKSQLKKNFSFFNLYSFSKNRSLGKNVSGSTIRYRWKTTGTPLRSGTKFVHWGHSRRPVQKDIQGLIKFPVQTLSRTQRQKCRAINYYIILKPSNLDDTFVRMWWYWS